MVCSRGFFNDNLLTAFRKQEISWIPTFVFLENAESLATLCLRVVPVLPSPEVSANLVIYGMVWDLWVVLVLSCVTSTSQSCPLVFGLKHIGSNSGQSICLRSKAAMLLCHDVLRQITFLPRREFSGKLRSTHTYVNSFSKYLLWACHAQAAILDYRVQGASRKDSLPYGAPSHSH